MNCLKINLVTHHTDETLTDKERVQNTLNALFGQWNNTDGRAQNG